MTSSNNHGHTPFPSLPIVSPEPPPRSNREKYGLLYLVGIAGLFIVVGLVGWFGYRVWLMRDIWSLVYVLHDGARSDDERIRAAYALGQNPLVEQRQRWEMSLRRSLPELARCVLAESVGPELVAEDPQGFVSAVARSPDWPGWLRLALTRPLAIAASQEHTLSRDRLGELCRQGDPILRLWALYALAMQPRPDPQTLHEIEETSRGSAPEHELAAMLLAAIPDGQVARIDHLEAAAQWNREHHPETRRVWQGWEVRNGILRRKSAD